ncbi:hypothetical protein [Nocardioides sp.]|uniref:hypothetical protein n=1 Tax=Nocardioides sp. TaxID=35761 RepID=UPI0039E30023
MIVMMKRLVPVVLLLALAACGSEQSATDSPEPGSSPASTERSPDDRATATTGGEAAAWILAEDRLPAGWRYATGQQHLGVPSLCGVTLEPPHLASVATQRFTMAWEGPFVVQYSFVSDDADAVESLMADWVEQGSSCTTTQVSGGTLAVNPISDIPAVGADFAALHGEATGGQARDYIAFRDGSQITVLVGYGLGSMPSHADLAAIAAAITSR